MPYCPACTATVLKDATGCGSCGAPFLEPNLGFLESRLEPQREATLPIPKPVPALLGILGLGGAAWGLMAIIATFAKVNWGFGTGLIYGLMTLLYVFSGYCGVRTLQGRYGWVRLNEILWAAQTPIVLSPLVSYTFASGGHITAWLQIYPSVRVGGNALLGSHLAINFLTPGTLAFGINVVALGIWLYLRRAQRDA